MMNFEADTNQALIFVDGNEFPILVQGDVVGAEVTAAELNETIGQSRGFGAFYSDRATDLIPDTRAFLDFPWVGYAVDGDALRTGRPGGYVVRESAHG